MFSTSQVERLDRLVLSPLSSLQVMFSSPQKLIQKRYDKLLDSCSSGSEEQLQAQRDYQALNTQLTIDLQRFNHAAQTILTNCLLSVIKLLRELTEEARPPIQQLPVRLTLPSSGFLLAKRQIIVYCRGQSMIQHIRFLLIKSVSIVTTHSQKYVQWVHHINRFTHNCKH